MSNTKKELLTEFREKYCGQVFYTIRDKNTRQLVRKEGFEVIERDPKVIEEWLSNKLDTLIQSKDNEWKEKIEEFNKAILEQANYHNERANKANTVEDIAWHKACLSATNRAYKEIISVTNSTKKEDA